MVKRGVAVVDEAGFDGVITDVTADAAAFGLVVDDVIVALVLPEVAVAAEDVVGQNCSTRDQSKVGAKHEYRVAIRSVVAGLLPGAHWLADTGAR